MGVLARPGGRAAGASNGSVAKDWTAVPLHPAPRAC